MDGSLTSSSQKSQIKRELFQLSITMNAVVCITLAKATNEGYSETWQQQSILDLLRSSGYRIDVVVVLARFETCATRVGERARKTGRAVEAKLRFFNEDQPNFAESLNTIWQN